MNVKLTRVSKTERSGSLRGEVVEGYASRDPAVGERFSVWREKENGDFRIVTTSTVQSILPDGEFTTFTGSRYKLEHL